MKRIWEENKVLLVLGLILIVCIAVVISVSLSYFYGSSDDVYGSRLDITKKVPLNKKILKDIEKTLKENECVDNIKTNIQGKIVYIKIEYKEKTTMDDAKKIALLVLPLFNEEELEVYDLQFIIKVNGEEGFTLMGARNSNGIDNIIWNNYNIKKEIKE